ncbi:putative enzyme [Paraburkholderia piptadeniae]|uniref:Enzyme n=1 Tax=Paraburkholderia piptadeniae TaxID=1701573 RepID=A0A1N7RIK4_9BURK|nr:SDR family NAD(P)-dependent oxidoreductase [Paraburkholderia piptadeniae]SIT34932.1 putative enzyme [Paraburkholderia piptadeniae]
MEVEGKVFVVTGAASGLGSAVALHLLQSGASVALADLDERTAADRVERYKDRAIAIKTDVTDSDAVTRLFETVRDRFGPVSGAVNCAGIAPAERILGRSGPHKLESFAKVIQINLVGTFNVMRIAAAAMAGQAPNAFGERGVIVNTASIAAYDGQIGQSAYAASKAGVAALTLPAARELASVGIRVVCVAPGIFETPMLQGLPQEVQDALGRSVPFPPRLGRPDEFASLVSEVIRNGYINGEVIRLDGALRMAPR